MNATGRELAKSNADRVRDLYDAWNRRDWPALFSQLSPDVEWFNATRHELVRGPHAVLDLLKSSADAFARSHVDVHELHEAGEHVIVEWIAKASKDQNAEGRTIVSEVQQYRDGKCIRGTTYGDMTELLIEAVAADPAPERIVVQMPRLSLQSIAGLAAKRSPGPIETSEPRARAS